MPISKRIHFLLFNLIINFLICRAKIYHKQYSFSNRQGIIFLQDQSTHRFLV